MRTSWNSYVERKVFANNHRNENILFYLCLTVESETVQVNRRQNVSSRMWFEQGALNF